VKFFNKIYDTIGVGIFIAMTFVVLLQILFRFVLHVSIPWTEEMSRLLFIFLGFFGLGIAVREKELIVIEFFLHKLKGRLRTAVDCFISLFTAAFFGVIFVGAFKMMRSAWPTYFSTMEWLSNGWLYFAAVLGMGGALFFIAADWCKAVIRKANRKGEQ